LWQLAHDRNAWFDVIVFCHQQHLIIINTTIAVSGEVFAWGDNRDGQLGLGTKGGMINTPEQVHFSDDGQRVKSVHSSWRASAALLGLLAVIINNNINLETQQTNQMTTTLQKR